jgi:hypothetical protein
MSLELAGLLVTSGAVPPTVVDDALRRQVLAGGAFDTALFEAGAALSEGDCLRFLEKASGLPGIDGPQLMATDPSAAALLPGKLAERHCLLPLREDDQLHVAVPFPVSKAMLEEVGFLLGKQLRPWVALEVRLREAISRIYRIPLPPRYATLAAMLGLTPAAPLPAPPELVEPAAAPTEPASPKFTAQTVPEQDPFRLIAENDGLVAALEKALEEAEKDPKLAHRRAAPRDKVDVAGLAGRIAAAAGTEAAEPLEKLTFGKAKAALAAAEDRHAIMGVALRFALKTFDFVAAFAVVGGNAVGWTSLTQEGFAPEKVERVSLPLDAPSVLRTVLFTRGRYLGPIPTDPISQQLVTGMGRPQPTVAFVGPIEVRERPVAILYADVVGRAVSDRKVAELVAFAQLVGRRLERLILENKRRLVAASQAAQPKDAAPNGAPAPQVAAPASEGAFLVPPTPTAAELFARGPSRPRKLAARAGLALPSIEPMPAPGVSRLSSRGATEAPAVEDLFAAADDLVSTDLAAPARPGPGHRAALARGAGAHPRGVGADGGGSGAGAGPAGRSPRRGLPLLRAVDRRPSPLSGAGGTSSRAGVRSPGRGRQRGAGGAGGNATCSRLRRRAGAVALGAGRARGGDGGQRRQGARSAARPSGDREADRADRERHQSDVPGRGGCAA